MGPKRSLPPSPSMIVALIALFVALGGTAAALSGRNSVDSGDIINGQVKKHDLAGGSVSNKKLQPDAVAGTNVLDGTLQTGDLGNDAVTGAKLADGTVGNADLADNSVTSFKIQDGSVASEDVVNDTLTGIDINESTLGQVPSAAFAASSDAVDGQSATTFSYSADKTGSFSNYTQVLNFGGLKLEANCAQSSGPAILTVRASTDTDNSFIRTSVGSLSNSDFDISESPATVFSADTSNGNGSILYRRGNSASLQAEVTSVTFAWIRNSLGHDCQFVGTVIGN